MPRIIPVPAIQHAEFNAFLCLKNNSYDQFYNEHIYVFSLIALNNILKKFHLEVYDVKNLSTHGGSLRYYIKKKINKNIKIRISVKKQLIKEKKFKLDKLSTYKKNHNFNTTNHEKLSNFWTPTYIYMVH